MSDPFGTTGPKVKLYNPTSEPLYAGFLGLPDVGAFRAYVYRPRFEPPFLQLINVPYFAPHLGFREPRVATLEPLRSLYIGLGHYGLAGSHWTTQLPCERQTPAVAFASRTITQSWTRKLVAPGKKRDAQSFL